MQSVLLCWQTEGIPAHWVEDIVALSPLHSGHDVSSGVAFWVANVQTLAGWVREHVQYVILWLFWVSPSLKKSCGQANTFATSFRQLCGCTFCVILSKTKRPMQTHRTSYFAVPPKFHAKRRDTQMFLKAKQHFGIFRVSSKISFQASQQPALL